MILGENMKKSWLYFKNYFWKVVYLLIFFIPIVIVVVLLSKLLFETKEIELLIGIIPMIAFGVIILFSVKRVFQNLDATLNQNLHPFNDYIIVSKDEYKNLLNNPVADYVVYEEFVLKSRKVYIMTNDKKILFKVIGNKIFSPYEEKVGSIKVCIFYPILFIKIKELLSFIAYRNLGMNFSKYYIRSKSLVYDEETETVRSSVNFSNIYTKVKYEDGFYFFDVRNKEFYLESIFLVIEVMWLEYNIRY